MQVSASSASYVYKSQGPANLDGTALERGSVLSQDVLRWLVILGIIAVALQAI